MPTVSPLNRSCTCNLALQKKLYRLKLRAAPGQTFAGWTFGLLPAHIDIVMGVSVSDSIIQDASSIVVRAPRDYQVMISLVPMCTTNSNLDMHSHLCWIFPFKNEKRNWFRIPNSFSVPYFQPPYIIISMNFIYHTVHKYHFPYEPELAQTRWKLSMLLLMFIYCGSLSLHCAIKGCVHSSKRG